MATIDSTPAACEFFVITDPYDYTTDNRPLQHLLDNDIAINTELESVRDEVVAARDAYASLDARLDDMGISKLYVVYKYKTTPDPTPTTGMRYLVDSPATGDFLGHEDEIAQYNGATWDFTVPDVTNAVTIENPTSDQEYEYIWDNNNWVPRNYHPLIRKGGTIVDGTNVIDEVDMRRGHVFFMTDEGTVSAAPDVELQTPANYPLGLIVTIVNSTGSFSVNVTAVGGGGNGTINGAALYSIPPQSARTFLYVGYNEVAGSESAWVTIN